MNHDEVRYLEYVEEDLVERHGVSESKAEWMVDNLGLVLLMKTDPDNVMHENIEYWSDWLVKQDKKN